MFNNRVHDIFLICLVKEECQNFKGNKLNNKACIFQTNSGSKMKGEKKSIKKKREKGNKREKKLRAALAGVHQTAKHGQRHHNNVPALMHHVSRRVYWQNVKSPRWLSLPYSPDLEPCDTLAFSQTKITFERDFRLLMRFRKI